jgi:hypothetical protein
MPEIDEAGAKGMVKGGKKTKQKKKKPCGRTKDRKSEQHEKIEHKEKHFAYSKGKLHTPSVSFSINSNGKCSCQHYFEIVVKTVLQRNNEQTEEKHFPPFPWQFSSRTLIIFHNFKVNYLVEGDSQKFEGKNRIFIPGGK